MIPALLLLLTGGLSVTSPPRLHLEIAVDVTGVASQRWLAMLRRRLPAARYDSLAAVRRPLLPGERAWADLITARRAAWEEEIPDLARLFDPVPPPATAVIVLDNRGGEDAFTHDTVTIGFDLAALHRVYGDAEAPDNAARIDRLFRHEYVHLLQKAWLGRYPYARNTPLRAAVAEIWAEGLGVWYSMSERWRAVEGQPSDHAAHALERLEPRFVSRLATLRCASAEQARRLTADLSFGPFEEKWGALPAALWLEREVAGDSSALRRFVKGGPNEVWELAERRLPAAHRAEVRKARAGGACPPR